jgi:hypothetical protein
MGTRLDDDAVRDPLDRGTAVTGRRERALRPSDPLAAFLSLLARPHAGEGGRRRAEPPTGLPIGKLPIGWHALATGSRADHLVVGPAGTFTLDSKDLIGKVWIGERSIRHNGHPTDFLARAVMEAGHASSMLTAAVGRPVDVGAVIAILADEWTIAQEPRAAHVGSPRSVKDWLVRLPATLSPRDVSEIAAAAGRSSTWMPRP